jgi:hypothetical protein
MYGAPKTPGIRTNDLMFPRGRDVNDLFTNVIEIFGSFKQLIIPMHKN